MARYSRCSSRREVVKFMAAGVAALTLPTVLYGKTVGKRSDIEIPWPGYDSFRLGTFDVTTIYDSGYELDVDSSYFAVGRAPAEVSSLLSSRFLPADKTIENIVTTLIEADDELLLIDTGVGTKGPSKPGELLTRMRSSGYQAEDVTAVAFTHLHRDNIGGVRNGEGAPTFPKASKYYIGEVEYKFWVESDLARTIDSELAALVKQTFGDLKDKIHLITEGDRLVEGLSAVETFGHTPGHMAFAMRAGEKRLLIAGDTFTHFVVSFERPAWWSKADIDRAEAATCREKVLAEISSQRTPVIGYHLPFPPVGFVEPSGDSYRWIPETYQLSL